MLAAALVLNGGAHEYNTIDIRYIPTLPIPAGGGVFLGDGDNSCIVSLVNDTEPSVCYTELPKWCAYSPRPLAADNGGEFHAAGTESTGLGGYSKLHQYQAPSLPPQETTFTWRATYYGPEYDGRQMGCPGSGLYSSGNPAIFAMGPSHYTDYPCGGLVRVCGPIGCIDGVREDSCPGCYGDWVDLSRAGLTAVCGAEVDSCYVSVEVR